MERIVNVLKCKKEQLLVLNPMGTFKGYGGFVGIYPYREVASDVVPSELGEIIVTLLAKSGPTGYKLDRIDEYRKLEEDEETRQVRARYFPEGKRRTTRILAQRFDKAEVRETKSRIEVAKLVYDSENRVLADDKDSIEILRKPVSNLELGAAVLKVIAHKTR